MKPKLIDKLLKRHIEEQKNDCKLRKKNTFLYLKSRYINIIT